MASLGTPRRIVTGNIALPSELADVPNPEPAVSIQPEEIVPVSLLDGNAAMWPVYTLQKVPATINNEVYNPLLVNAGLQSHEGVTVQFNDLAAGAKVPLHRTTSTDYMVFLQGTVHLICPAEAYDPAKGPGNMVEMECKPGDIVMQRGTLHAWENRGTELARFVGVGIRSEPVEVAVEGKADQKLVINDAWDP